MTEIATKCPHCNLFMDIACKSRDEAALCVLAEDIPSPLQVDGVEFKCDPPCDPWQEPLMRNHRGE